MFKSIKSFKYDQYLKNISIIISGTTLAQIIQLSITPILTRIYTQEDFGYLGTVLTFSAFLSVFLTLRYELVLFIDRNVNIVKMFTGFLIKYILLLAFIYFFIIGIFVFFIYGDDSLYTCVLIFLLSIVTVYNQLLNNNLNRAGFYKQLSFSRILLSVGVGLTQLIFFYFLPDNGLVWGVVFGTILVIMYLFYICNKNSLITYNIEKDIAKDMLLRYRNFPLFDVPSSLLSLTASLLPNAFFMYFFFT
ncbi:oligosaccharide flippase family protein [Avibacterium volantium]|uniref:Polysaccharide biosynthesis protein n=1 Tax=Avibacterium volantium TaxID=762 RepID=A0A447SSM8_AVIVO|nr:oligosaccharide flippase family protein [Avibacterium volantium]VEB24924.1 Polysaccharide biosynthesis protein [Avibacterium volantium]